MFVRTYSTIRSVFSKASDLPIILERLNATTYVYATLKKNAKNIPSYWMFNFLYFTEPEKVYPSTRHPVVNWEENLDFNYTITDNTSVPILWPISYSLLSTTNTTKIYIQFFSTSRKPFARFTTTMPYYEQKANSIDQEISATNEKKLFTGDSSTVPYIPFLSDETQSSNTDENYQFIENTSFDSQERENRSLETTSESGIPSIVETSSNPQTLPTSTSESVISNDDLRPTIDEGENLSLNQITQSQDYESKKTPSYSKHFN
ncbi:unnamed protein product, partial [Rotaria sp. Silwood1]